MAKQALADVEAPAAERATGMRGVRSLIRPLLHVVLALLAVTGLLECASFVATALAYPRVGYDFNIYFAAALALRDNAHANIYSLSTLQAAAAAHHAASPEALYLYPPVLAALLIPLTLAPYAVALRIWLLLSLLCWLLGAALLAIQIRRLLGPDDDLLHSPAGATAHVPLAARMRRWLAARTDADLFAVAVATFLVLAYGPLMQSFQLGQVTMLIFAIVAVLPPLETRGSHGTAGVLLGLATLLKLFPAVLIAYFALRGRRRLVWVALATIVVATIALVPIIGLDGVLSARQVLTNGGANAQQYHNQSLARVPLWLAISLGGGPSQGQTAIGYGLLVAALGAFACGVAIKERRRPWREDLPAARPSVPLGDFAGYGWALTTMLLVTPIFWEHYDAWLLPAIAWCLGLAVHSFSAHTPRFRSPRRLAVLALGAGLAAYALTTNALPFAYDGVATLSPGPYLAGHLLRPYFMLFRPAAALLIWVASAAHYLSAESIPTGATVALPDVARADIEPTCRTRPPESKLADGLLLLVALALPASILCVDTAVGIVTTLAVR